LTGAGEPACRMPGEPDPRLVIAATTGTPWPYPACLRSEERFFGFWCQCLRTTMNATAPRPTNAIRAP